jgi:hypothetical protein
MFYTTVACLRARGGIFNNRTPFRRPSTPDRLLGDAGELFPLFTTTRNKKQTAKTPKGLKRL